jgi:uncharacterized protein YvpB
MSSIGAKNFFQNVELKQGVNKTDFQAKTEKAMMDGVLTKEEFLNIKDDLNIKSGVNFDAILKQLPTEKEVAAALNSKPDMKALQARAEQVLPELGKLLDSEDQPISFVQPKTRADIFVQQVKALNPSSLSFDKALEAKRDNLPEIKSKDQLLAKIKDPDLRKDLSQFIAKTGGGKEELNNLNQVLFGNKPPLNQAQMANLVYKLLTLVDEKNYEAKVNPKELALAALKDIAHPESIVPNDKSVTMGTFIQAKLAAENPNKYLGTVWALATGSPLDDIKPDLSLTGDKSGKSPSGQIMQKTFSKPEFLDLLLPQNNTKFVEPKSLNELTNIISILGPSEKNPVQVALPLDPNNKDSGLYLVKVVGMDKANRTLTVVDSQGNKSQISEKDLAPAKGVFIPKELFTDNFSSTMNPLDARLDDIGISKFYNAGKDSRTKEDIKAEILTKVKPELKEAVKTLADNLPNKMSMVYLQHLLFDRAPKLSDDQLLALTKKLTEMAGADYSKLGIKNNDLIEAALHDIAAPQDIAQENIGTCAGTSVQIELALKDPAKYLNMLDSLAQDQPFPVTGKKDGKDLPPIKPNNTYLDEGKDGKLDSKRTISCKIMQNAIMTYGDLAENIKPGAKPRNYDSSSTSGKVNAGLGNEGSLHVKTALYGDNFKAYGKDESPAQLVSILQKAKPSLENPVQISMSYTDKGRDSLHAVDVVGIDGNNVTIINPWGRQETFPVKVLEERIIGVIADKKLGAEKLDNNDFNKLLGNPAELVKTINTKGEAFFNTLNSEQKGKLLATLNSPAPVSAENKEAIFKVLGYIFGGTDVQLKINSGAIDSSLKNVALSDILGKLPANDPRFNAILAKAAIAAPGAANFALLTIVTDPEKGPKFIASLDFEKKTNIISEIAKNGRVGPVNAAIVTPILASIVKDKDFTPEKFLADLDTGGKTFVLGTGNPLGAKMFGNLSPEKQNEIISNLAETIADEDKTTKEQKPKLQEAALNFVQNLLKGKDPAACKAIIENLMPDLEKVLPEDNPATQKIIGIAKPQGTAGGAAETAGMENPLGAVISDTGVSKFNGPLNDPSVTAASLKAKLLERLGNDPLKDKVTEILNKLPDNKEALLYLNQLIFERKPMLGVEQAGRLLDTINKMLGPDNKYDVLAGKLGKKPEDVKKDLVISALHDIAAPEDIAQGNIGSCAATCVQIKLALQNPEKYLECVDKLAKDQSFNGIPPNWSFKDEGGKDKLNTGRTLSCKIIQNAFMDFGDGARKFDSSSTNKNDNYGMYDSGVVEVRKAVFGTSSNIYSLKDYSPKQMVSMIGQAQPSSANPVTISMVFNNENKGGEHAVHVVNVVGIDKEKQTVTIINPWGRTETFPVKSLEDRVLSIVDDRKLGPDKTKDPDTSSREELGKTVISKGDSFLDTLKFDQKAEVISALAKAGNLTEQDKAAIIKVIGNILQGSNFQDAGMAAELSAALKSKGIELYPALLNSVKSDSKEFMQMAADLGKNNIYYAADLLNDPALGPKFLQSLNTEDKTKMLGNMCNFFASYPSGASANSAITALCNNLLTTADFKPEKLINNLNGFGKAIMVNLENPATTGLLNKFSPEQKIEFIRTMGKEENKLDPEKPADKQILDYMGAAGVKMIKGMLEGKTQAEQGALMTKIVTGFGQDDAKSKTATQALDDGQSQIVDFLPKSPMVMVNGFPEIKSIPEVEALMKLVK